MNPRNGLERWPTADPELDDVSPAAVCVSAAAPADRSEECVCGGLISVRRGGDIAAAVRLHNASGLHREYRWRRVLGVTGRP